MASKYPEGTPASDLVADYASIIKGKTILTTGVTPGSVGAAYVEAVAAAQPALLILAGRNAAKLDQEAANIAAKHPSVPTRKLLIDLSSQKSVRRAADEVLSSEWSDVEHIDVVHNCAGIMAVPYQLSEDGYELQFAANHLGHFLFTNLIMDKILKAEAPRVLNVSSNGHRLSHIRFGDINFDEGKLYNKWFAYGQSKTANCLMARSLAEKLGSRGLRAFSLHPGLIMESNLGAHLTFTVEEDLGSLLEADRLVGSIYGFSNNFSKIVPLTSEQGASTSVFASFDPSLNTDHNGAYLQENGVADPLVDTVKPWITSSAEAELLWRRSEEIVGQKFSY